MDILVQSSPTINTLLAPACNLSIPFDGSKNNQKPLAAKKAKNLVDNTKSVHASVVPAPAPAPAPASESVCESTGSLLGGVGAARSERYKLQKAASDILFHLKKDDGRPFFRVTGCLRSKVEKGTVKILKGQKSDTCFFANLQRCGSVWTCPVCAAQITNHRASEIIKAQEAHTKNGFMTLMLTLTHSHKLNTKLVDTMQNLPLALKYMRNQRAYKNLLQNYDYQGLIRALETTYSDVNGFHVHTHELLFFNKNALPLGKIKDVIFDCWLKACKKYGLGEPSRARGVDLKVAFSPSDYLQKFDKSQNWGAAPELTKSHVKKGKNTSLTAFDFLRLASSTDSTIKNKYSDLFTEYALSFYGKRQLYWSRGLKKHFKIDEITDDEILEDELDDAEIVAEISPKNWTFICSLPFDVRGSLLRYAELGGFDAVHTYIAYLKTEHAP